MTNTASIPLVLQKSYYPVLDGLRGLAILLVVFHHFGGDNFTLPYGFFIDSNAGVHIFFVLSGFLITTLLLKEKAKYGGVNLWYFYLRRALRILPVAYLFLVVLIGLKVIFHAHVTAIDFLESFLFLKNLPIPSSYYTAHFWSLAVELQFYLVFPVLLIMNTNRYLLLAIAIVVIVPIISILSYYHVPFLFDSRAGILIAKLCSYIFWKGPTMILVGSVFSILVFQGIIDLSKIKTSYYLSFILLIAALIIKSPTFVLYYKYIGEYIAVILFAFVIILSLNTKSLLSDVLSSRLMIRIGVLSYSIYIWQQLFVGTTAWEPWLAVFRTHPLWILFIFKLAAIFIIASVSFVFEKRFLRIKNKFEPK